MAPFTVIEAEARTVDASVRGDRVVLAPEALPDALGWEARPEGLCRGDVCVPVRDAGALRADGGLDLVAVARALGRTTVVDGAAGIAAVSLPVETRRAALHGREAPAFTLADLDGVPRSSSEWNGEKKLLVAFASW